MSEINWGYSVNRHMDEARRSVAASDEHSDLIRAKLEAANEGGKIGGVKGIGIIQDRRDEARALIAAMIEKHLPSLSEERNLISNIFETVLDAETLRMTDSVRDKFTHQLKLEKMCHTLAGAVLFLLCKQLPLPAPPSEADKT